MTDENTPDPAALAEQKRSVQNRAADVQASAHATGEPPPEIRDLDKVSQVNPDARSPQDKHTLDTVDQDVRGAEGRQLQRAMSSLLGFAAPAALMASLSDITSLAQGFILGGGEEVSRANLFTPEINPGQAVAGMKSAAQAMVIAQ